VDAPTRNLLAALGDEGNDALLAELRGGARTETELRSRTQLSHRGANERLRRLQDVGVITSVQQTPSGPGRPARQWQLTHPELLQRFVEQANAVSRGFREPPLRD
jgi:predicted ArsR family transcriptional regulator